VGDAARRVQALQGALQQEVALAVAAATASAVDIGAVHEAEARAARLEGQVEALLAEREVLQQQLTALEQQVRRWGGSARHPRPRCRGLQGAQLPAALRAPRGQELRGCRLRCAPTAVRHLQVSELHDVKEVTSAAVLEVEATLGRIEAAAARGALAGCASPRRPPAKRSASASASSSGSGPSRSASRGSEAELAAAEQLSLPVLSRELVRAKLQAADLQRKLRVAARAEVELRQRLNQRDERIGELKDGLGARSRAYEDLKARLAELDPLKQQQVGGCRGGQGGAGRGG
jgi:DNA repair exonuclease SbcCD ATPase subunit